MDKFEKLRKSRDGNVDYIKSEIKKIIQKFDKRDPGGRGERQAQEYMKGELATMCDRTFIEDFPVHPKAFYGWIRLGILAMLLSLIFYFFIPLVSVALMGVALAASFQFIFYKGYTDFLYKKKTSCNVTALKKPQGEVKRRILLNGHADATWEWTINYRFGGKVFSVSLISIMVGIVSVTGVSIVGLVVRAVQGTIFALPIIDFVFWMGIAMFAFIPVMCVMWFFTNNNVVVDGANDNLTGCYIPISIMKALKDNDVNLENTEIGVILTGSEEIGLRGAKAWAKTHKDDFNDVPTFIISFDTLHELSVLNINDIDLNNICFTDKDVCSLLKTSSQNVDAKASFYSVTVGATDAAAFAQGGFKSACVTALDHSLKPYYHTRRDNYDNLSTECLQVVYDMTVETIRIFDSGKYDDCDKNRVRSFGIRHKFPKH